MPPDHDHFDGSVNLDDAESVIREIDSPIPVGLRHTPGRETGDQASGIFFQLRKFLRLPWLVSARPEPGSLAGLAAGPGTGLSFALAPWRPAERAGGTS